MIAAESSLTSDDLSSGDVMLHCSTVVESVVVVAAASIANATDFLGDLSVCNSAMLLLDAAMTCQVIISIHHPKWNIKKSPTANVMMMKSDGFAWHAACFSKTAQPIIMPIYYNMVT